MLSPVSDIVSDASEDDEALDFITELDNLEMEVPDCDTEFVDEFLESTGNSTTHLDVLPDLLATFTNGDEPSISPTRDVTQEGPTLPAGSRATNLLRPLKMLFHHSSFSV